LGEKEGLSHLIITAIQTMPIILLVRMIGIMLLDFILMQIEQVVLLIQ